MKKIQYYILTVLLLFCINFTALAQCQCSAKDAIEYVGEYCEVTGTVVSTYQSNWNGTVFLNFGNDYPNQFFKVVVFADDLNNFKNNPTNYEGDKVCVRGKIAIYKGDVQIIIEGEEEIEIVE